MPTPGVTSGAFGGILGSSSSGPAVLTVSLQVAFGHGPLDPNPVFTEIGSKILQFNTTMGRQHQLDRVEPSTLTAMLDGRNGEFAPWTTLSPYYNLLSNADATVAGGTWAATAGTFALQSTRVLAGTSAGRLTSTGGTASAATAAGTSGYAVTPSSQYSVGAFFRAETTPQNVSVGVNWYTSSGTQIGVTVFGTAIADTTTGWTQATLTTTSPANAAFAAVVVSAASSGTLAHDFDCVQLSFNKLALPIGWAPGQTSPMVPGKPVKGVATWSGVPYPFFYGFTDAWTPMPKDQVNQDYQLSATDVIKQLNLKYLSNPTLYPNTVLALSPLAYWRFSETSGVNAADSSGNGRTATYWGGPNLAQNSAQMYDPSTSVSLQNGGTTGYGGSWIVAPNLPNQGGPSSGPFSFEAWFKTTSTSQQLLTMAANAGTHPTAVWFGVDGNGRGTLFDGIANLPPGTLDGLGWGAEVVTGPPVNDGLWHHVVVTMSQASGGTSLWGLYIDGVLQGSWSGETWNSTISLPLYVGGLFGRANSTEPNPIGTFDGSVDEVAVYGSVLTGAQVLNNFTVGSYFQNIELTGKRIAKALIVAGYGSYPQNLAAGTVLCQGETNPVTQSLCGDYVLIANDTENGLLYQDPTGTLQFKDRHYPQLNGTSTNSQATFGDNSAVAFNYDVTGLNIPQDDLDLWPSVKAQRNNGVIQEVVNVAAVAASGDRTLQRSGLIFETDADALILAQWLNYLYAFPLPRVAAVLLSSITGNGANLPQMLGRALWDAVTIQRQGPGESQLNAMMAVEAVQHAFDASDPSWKTTFQLSPFEVSAKANAVLIWGTGKWGTNVWGG